MDGATEASSPEIMARAPASDLGSQVGGFASNNRSAGPRPVLAPAPQHIIAQIKEWALDALGGAPLQPPSGMLIPGTAGAPATDSSSPALLPLEFHVRQMACRKPDCVPLETVVLLLGEGWHEKEELLMAADQVSKENAAEAARALWAKAESRAATLATRSTSPAVKEDAVAAPMSQLTLNQATVESIVGNASATTAAPAGVAAVEERVDQADFQAAASFEGPREGFVYRTGAWGSGYYLDLPPVPPSDRVHGTDKQTTEQTAANLAAVEEELFTKKAVVSTEGSASGSGGSSGSALPVVLPRDITDYAFTEDEVYVVGTNGRKVTIIAGLEHLAPTLTELVLRSHVIARMEGLETLVHLTKLELYDNAIEELECLEFLPQLTILDMSYNSIRSMAPVAHCPKLQELYLAQNKLRELSGLENLSSLQKLDVGGNRIRSLQPVAQCTALVELWAGKNKVEAIGSALEGLTALKRLDVQSNRLVFIDGLGEAQASSLEELYLARNGLTSLFVDQDSPITPAVEVVAEPSSTVQPQAVGAATAVSLASRVPCLGKLQALNTVDLSSNRIVSLAGLGACQGLNEVWASGNAITNLELGVVGVAPASSGGDDGESKIGEGELYVDGGLGDLDALPELTCVYLEHNPAALALGNGAAYRAALKAKLPRLTQIDATSV